MMQTIKSLPEWIQIRKNLSRENAIGFVPTMGNLHKGHLSLIKRSISENAVTVLSIFVNPTQFDEEADLDRYPRSLNADLERSEECGVDFVLFPDKNSIYPDNYRYKLSETELSKRFCGKHRPGHFDGVLTVVMKLLQLVRPDKAYFGEKDYQQYLLIRDMAKSFFLETEIIACPLVRDSDGLALSSRNKNLTPGQRELAIHFPKILSQPGTAGEIFERLSKKGFDVDYVDDFESRRLGAVRIGNIRLIDNVVLGGG